jgi:hypothetical protein
VAQCVSIGIAVDLRNMMSRGAAAFFSTILVILRIEMSPLRGLKVFKRTCFPNAHALGYLDIAAPRLIMFLRSTAIPMLTHWAT